MPLPAVSVIVPCLNEAGNIEPFYGELKAALTRLSDWEAIFVDDGSTDATAQAVLQLNHTDPRIRLIRHRTRYGQSAAIATGVRKASSPRSHS